jgi:tRNA U38,U39,U40 pseudouridine synthase TruA
MLRLEVKVWGMIEIKHSAGDEWVVSVHGTVTTHHRVRITKADLDRLGQGRSAESLLTESFQFLLEREPNTSILPSFDLSLISRYFPEYEQHIHERLNKAA